jgi:hypothetical protein
MKQFILISGLVVSLSSLASADIFTFSCFGQNKINQIEMNMAGSLNHHATYNKLLLKRQGFPEGVEANCRIKNMHYIPDGRVEIYLDCGKDFTIQGEGFTKDLQERDGLFSGSKLRVKGILGGEKFDLDLQCEAYYDQSPTREFNQTSEIKKQMVEFDPNSLR